MAKLNKKHFEHFVTRCKHWIDYYNLYDYNFIFKQEALVGNEAECRFSLPGKEILIVLSTETDDDDIFNSLDNTAHHEVCEAMLSDFRTYVAPSLDDDVDYSVHSVIHRLWNAVISKKADPMI